MAFVYINSRGNTSEYPCNYVHPLTNHVRNDGVIRDRPPSIAGNVIPRPCGNSFWGRLSAYDHLSIKRMVKKEPELLNIRWCELDPLTSLFHRGSYLFRVSDEVTDETKRKHAVRFLKMIRLLIKLGCKVDSHLITPYIERYHFYDEIFAKKTLDCLLHKGLCLDSYTLLNESEVMLLERIKFERNETFVFWGRKVISDYIRLKKRKFFHVYLRDIVPCRIILNYDVIGVITSFI